jgi:hypothetical protein
MNVTLYATSAPAHDHKLYVAPRPLPGRQVGHCHGMVFDVPAEFEDAARRDDGKLITVVTEAQYEQIVTDAVEADGYSRQEYEDAGMEWDARDIGMELGLPLITIIPSGL